MTTHNIAISDNCNIAVHVTPGKSSTDIMYVKFERTTPVDVGVKIGELFLTPDQMVKLGNYLIEQANTSY